MAEEKAKWELTKKDATQGKKVRLNRQWKAIAATMPTKEARRHYLNMMLLATRISETRPPKASGGGVQRGATDGE